MSDTTIITIGRQFGSGGHEVGRRLAAELGIKLYDKELLKMVAQESNICEQVLGDYDEKPTNSLLYSIVMDVYPSMNYVGNTLSQQIYQAQYDTIRRIGQKGSCVIVGRAADYILRENPHLTSVFIHASMEYRIRLSPHPASLYDFSAVRPIVTEQSIGVSSFMHASFFSALYRHMDLI